MSWMEIRTTAGIAEYLGVSCLTLKIAKRQRNHVYIKARRPTKNGKVRDLCYPRRECELWVVQKAIKEKCLELIPVADEIRGYLKGQHNINVSQLMAGTPFQAMMDIEKFHPNITHQMVEKSLKRKGLSWPWCRLISQLVTFEKAIPQGACTSNHLANLVIDFVFAQGILAHCRARGVKIVNYGDDTAFGGTDRAAVNECVDQAKRIFARCGFKTNEKCAGAEHVGAARKFIGTSTARAHADLTRKQYRKYRKEQRAARFAEIKDAVNEVTDSRTMYSLFSKIKYTARLNPRKARALKEEFFRIRRIHVDKFYARKKAEKPPVQQTLPFGEIEECPFDADPT